MTEYNIRPIILSIVLGYRLPGESPSTSSFTAIWRAQLPFVDAGVYNTAID